MSDSSGRVVGKPYLGITSCLPVIRPVTGMSSLPVHGKNSELFCLMNCNQSPATTSEFRIDASSFRS
jgi:hypothetical protein